MDGFDLELSFAVRYLDGRSLPAEELHTQGELLMEALLDLERLNDSVEDPATSSDAEAGVVTVQLHITAPTDDQAFSTGKTVCRTAIHAIGGSTPSRSAGPPAGPTATRADFIPRHVQFDYV